MPEEEVVVVEEVQGVEGGEEVVAEEEVEVVEEGPTEEEVM